MLENICYSAHHYNTEKARCTKNSDNFEKSVSLAEYFGTKDCPYESITLDFGRFQATEGLFNPDAWGLDHPGLHKLVHKAIMVSTVVHPNTQGTGTNYFQSLSKYGTEVANMQ